MSVSPIIVANRVIQHEKHVLNGATLDVSIEMSETSKTILVTGLSSQTTKDSLWNYFENTRRSGGGYVESVEIQRDNGVAFVTFEDASGKRPSVLFKVALSRYLLSF